MKTMFVINPSAGRGQCEHRWKRFETVLQHSATFAYETYYTSYAGEAETVSKEAVRNGFNRIIAVGGDGTVNELVNGIFGSGCVFGMLPFGTGNDLARTLEIPKSETVLLQMLNESRCVEVNVARMNHRYFMIAAGIGFDGIVANYINDHRSIKRFGTLGYALSAFRILGAFSPCHAKIIVDGREYSREKTWLIAIGNCPYYGGGMKVCPEADYNDDLLDICIVSNLSKSRFIQLFPSVYSGRHTTKDRYVTMIRGRQIEIACPEYMISHADGELIHSSTLRIELCEKKLAVLKP